MAVKFWDFFTRTLALVGKIVMLMGPMPGVTVTAAEADLVLSETAVAVSMTPGGFGAVAGAV